MNRDEFAKRLYSTIIPEGTAPEIIQALIRPVSETIREIMPNRLFRFRAFDERSVDAFENDIIYAVTADKFNDPYDTLVRYDLEGVEKWMNTVMNIETLGQMKAWYAQGWDLPKEVKHILPKEMTDLYIFRLMDLSCSVPSVRIDPGISPVVEEYCKLHQKYLEVEKLFGIDAK